MFTKHVIKSVAGATAVGATLAMSLVATPAVVTTAPEIRTVACAYPDSIATLADVTLRRVAAPYGTSNLASVTVERTDTGGAATGSVRFTVASGGSVYSAATVTLSGGSASWTMPSRLPSSRTYTVRADYRPTCRFRADSDAAFYTVYRARTNTSVEVRNVSRGVTPVARGFVASPSPLNPPGRVRIVVTRRAVEVHRETVPLQGGAFSASLRRFRPGYFQVEATYLGSTHYKSSKGEDDFRVFRR